MRKLLVIILSACIVIIFVGCRDSGRPVGTTSQTTPTAPPRVAGVSPAMVEGLDVKAAPVLANQWKTEAPEVETYVDTGQVSFEFKNGKKVTIPLPSDQMVVAVAPYINYTHPCEVHYMSGCQGELVDVPVKVVARTADGDIVLEETMRTMSNGFIELWLPRNEDFSLFIEAKGLHAEESISTRRNSNTCITTIKLG